MVPFGENKCSYFWNPCIRKLANLLTGMREEDFYNLISTNEKIEWLADVRKKAVTASIGWGLAPVASILTRPDFLAASEPVFKHGYLLDLINPYDSFGDALAATMRITRKLKDELVVMSDASTGLINVREVPPGGSFEVEPDGEELFLVADNLPRDLDRKLERFGEVTRNWNRLEESTVVIVRTSSKLGRKEMKLARRLKLVVTATHGLDHIDLNEAKRRAIIVERAPVRARAVAELTLGLILDLARGISLGDRKIRSGEWAKKRLKGFELAGRNAGIVSMGVVGSEISSILSRVGMNVSFYDKYRGGGKPLERLLRESDVIVIASPLTEETKGMIGRKELEIVKDGAIIVNVGRGEVIDLEALLDHLESGKIGGAAIDVFPKEPPFSDSIYGRLRELDNVVLTPHIGGNTLESDRRITKEVTRIIARWFSGN